MSSNTPKFLPFYQDWRIWAPLAQLILLPIKAVVYSLVRDSNDREVVTAFVFWAVASILILPAFISAALILIQYPKNSLFIERYEPPKPTLVPKLGLVPSLYDLFIWFSLIIYNAIFAIVSFGLAIAMVTLTKYSTYDNRGKCAIWAIMGVAHLCLILPSIFALIAVARSFEQRFRYHQDVLLPHEHRNYITSEYAAPPSPVKTTDLSHLNSPPSDYDTGHF